MNDKTRSPQAFKIELGEAAPNAPKAALKPQRTKPQIEFEAEPMPTDLAQAPMAQAHARHHRFRWGYLLVCALLALLAMWFSLFITTLIGELFALSVSLGWLSVSVATIALTAAGVILLREFIGLFRLRRIEHLQIAAARAINLSDRAAAMEATHALQTVYAKRPDMAWGLHQWGTYKDDIIDPPEAMRLAERILLEPLDEQARRIIAKYARRVTLTTTVLPAATLDIILVGAQNLFMVREIATLYGGRPSFIATLRLARMVATHLAITAGLAMSDNLLHLFVGKGVLGRLSARFGEGAINGILTSRIGLAACDVCRPIASTSQNREALMSLVKALADFSGPEAKQETINR